jgi:hypothetical protein
MYYNATAGSIYVTTVAVQKQEVLRILNASAASVIQHTNRMRRITLSSVACPDLPKFSTLSLKRQEFLKESYWTQSVCFDFIYSLRLKHFSSKKNWARYDQNLILVFRSSNRYSCWGLKEDLNIFEIPGGEKHRHQISRKSAHSEPSFSMKTVAFHNSANAPKSNCSTRFETQFLQSRESETPYILNGFHSIRTYYWTTISDLTSFRIFTQRKKVVPYHSAPRRNPRRAHIWFISRRKPDIPHNPICYLETVSQLSP